MTSHSSSFKQYPSLLTGTQTRGWTKKSCAIAGNVGTGLELALRIKAATSGSKLEFPDEVLAIRELVKFLVKEFDGAAGSTLGEVYVYPPGVDVADLPALNPVQHYGRFVIILPTPSTKDDFAWGTNEISVEKIMRYSENEQHLAREVAVLTPASPPLEAVTVLLSSKSVLGIIPDLFTPVAGVNLTVESSKSKGETVGASRGRRGMYVKRSTNRTVVVVDLALSVERAKKSLNRMMEMLAKRGIGADLIKEKLTDAMTGKEVGNDPLSKAINTVLKSTESLA